MAIWRYCLYNKIDARIIREKCAGCASSSR